MENKTNQPTPETYESKAKKVWKGIGIGALSVALAVFTVIVLNI